MQIKGAALSVAGRTANLEIGYGREAVVHPNETSVSVHKDAVHAHFGQGQGAVLLPNATAIDSGIAIGKLCVRYQHSRNIVRCDRTAIKSHSAGERNRLSAEKVDIVGVNRAARALRSVTVDKLARLEQKRSDTRSTGDRSAVAVHR